MVSSVLGLCLFVKGAYSSPYEVTVFDPENVSVLSEQPPLSIHVNPDALSPEVVEKLGQSSNIIFADLPNSPQFVSLKDYQNMMFATNELLDELLQQNRSNESTNNSDNNQIEESLNEEEKENYDLVQKTYEETLRQKGNHQEHEPEETEPATEEYTTTSTIMETHPKTTVIETESTCNECVSHSTPSQPVVSTSSFVETTPASTSAEAVSSCPHSSSIDTSSKKHHKTTASVTASYGSSGSGSKKTHPSISSKHYDKHHNSTKIHHPKLNHTNHTLIGFHNASSSTMPATMFIAFLISILVFAQMC